MPITPPTPEEFLELTNIKEKYEALVFNANSICEALKDKFPIPIEEDPPEQHLWDWIDNVLIPAIGNDELGYCAEVVTRLNEMDNQRLQNCMSYGPIKTVMESVKDSFKDVQDGFIQIRDYLFKGTAFDTTYDILYDFWETGEIEGIDAWLTGIAEPHTTKINDLTDQLNAKMAAARTATSGLSSRFLSWLGTSKVAYVFKDFIKELGCIGEVTPETMWDYRSDDLKEDMEMVYDVMDSTSFEPLEIIIKDKVETLATEKKGILTDILNDIKP
jgi:hypothetical protein